MADIDKTYSVKHGLSIDDVVGIFESDTDPTIGVGNPAPIGSILLDTNGKLWVKFGVNDTDWNTPVTIPDDHKVLLTNVDSTPDYLGSKISAGSGISFAIQNPGANEVLEISAQGGTDELVKISASDTTGDYLQTKLVQGNGVVFTTNNIGANETLQIDLASNFGLLGLGAWKFDTSTTPPPSNKQFSFDSSTASTATKLYVSTTNDANKDMTNFLLNAGKNSVIYIQDEKDSTVGAVVLVSAVTDNTSYVTYDIQEIDTYGTINSGARKYAFVIAYSADFSGLQAEVDNIEAASGGIYNPDGTYGGTTVDNALTNVTNSTDLLDTLSQLETGLTAQYGDLASITLGFATSIAIPTAWANVSFDVDYLQNNTNVLEHSTTNQDRVLIKETGLYFMNFSMSFDADSGEERIEGRFLIDDTTVVPGSYRLASEDDEINDLSNAFTAELTAGTYITFQHRAQGNGNVLHNSTNISITRATGIKGQDGAQGPPGSGTTIVVRQDGTLVPNSPFTTLNFVGINAVDGGGGEVDISPIKKQSIHAHNNTTTQVLSTLFVTLRVGTNTIADPIYSNSNGSITINSSGRFKITYDVSADATSSTRSSSEARLQVNGVDVPGTTSFGYHRRTSEGKTTGSATTIVNITSGDVVRVRIRKNSGGVVTVARACRITIEQID